MDNPTRPDTLPAEAQSLQRTLVAYLQSVPESPAVDPGHRIPFHWPPHAVSHSFHVMPEDWREHATIAIDGEEFNVDIAETPHGVFGRCRELWHEARAADRESILAALVEGARPLFDRQMAIARTLGRTTRYQGPIRELPNDAILRLLYCPDRDVANDARTVIELRASQGVWLPALVTVLNDRRHPYRRSAQWCVLDLFEDLPSFAKTRDEELLAVDAMRGLLWDAEDDYCRTIFKAGVVLGGHVPNEIGGPALIECLQSPSKVGRRAAIHGVFHVVEWGPHNKPYVLAGLRQIAGNDPEPLLREYAAAMARDIEAGGLDHVGEPLFPEELSKDESARSKS
ncbi:MAG: hypothetical protein SNJ74_11610 [Fimbriimonadaceae bacterium]